VKRHLLLIVLIIISLSAYAQRDSISISVAGNIRPEISDPAISIYPVPVRENYFTIKSDKEIAVIKITNIIGQDIFRENYSNPVFIVKIILQSPKRGMYLVSISFTDGTRVVRKIMIEGTV
jgi:hypothetical protein